MEPCSECAEKVSIEINNLKEDDERILLVKELAEGGFIGIASLLLS